jgi:hypothetical protein
MLTFRLISDPPDSINTLTTSISTQMKSAETTPVSMLDVRDVTMIITRKDETDTPRSISLVISESRIQSEITQLFSSASFTAAKCQASTAKTLDKFLSFIKTCCSNKALQSLASKSDDDDATRTSVCIDLFESVSESLEHHSLAFGAAEPKPHVKDIIPSLNHRVLKLSQKASVIDNLCPLLSSVSVLREVDDVAGKISGHFTRRQPANRLFFRNFSDDCGNGHILYFNMDETKSLTINRLSIDLSHSTLNMSDGSSVQLEFSKEKINLLSHGTLQPSDRRSAVEVEGFDAKRFSVPISKDQCLPNRDQFDVRINSDNMEFNPGPPTARIVGGGKIKFHIPLSLKLDQVTKQRYVCVSLFSSLLYQSTTQSYSSTSQAQGHGQEEKEATHIGQIEVRYPLLSLLL